ncbi:hypothetical protein [Streptomyces prasinopilosus]|uniref:hypothetical protein n=1 Tax=Streptomyces prasinopilosus TaxID=67344 RepID=UPI0006EB9AF6|nr:hypothetical protein [Streptomyces prasinopilosus]
MTGPTRIADADIRNMLARRAGLTLLRGLADLTRRLPSPDGPALRVTVTVIATGEEVGSVDVDATNTDDVGHFASRRAETFRAKTTPTPAAGLAVVSAPAPAGTPVLRLVGGGR